MRDIFLKTRPNLSIIGFLIMLVSGLLLPGGSESMADNKETSEISDTGQIHGTEDSSPLKSNEPSENEKPNALPESVEANDLTPVRVTIAPVKKEKLVMIVKTIGTLDPVVEELSFKISGRLSELLVDEGNRVKKDQVIARLELDDALNNQARQRLALDQARRKFERIEKLYNAGSSNQENYEDAMNYLEQVRIQYSQARLNVERCTLKAPSDGRILKKHLDYFTTVNPGQPIFTFQDSNEPWIVKANLTDRQVFSIHVGTPAEVTFDPYPDRIFQGRISHIALQANPSDGLYEVELTLASQNRAHLIPGMVADVKLVQTSERAYSIVPLASLLNLKGMEGYLFVASPDLKYALKKSVRLNSIFKNSAALEDELDQDQKVIVHGNQRLEDKNPIIVVQ